MIRLETGTDFAPPLHPSDFGFSVPDRSDYSGRPTSTLWHDPWGQPAFWTEPDGPSHFNSKLRGWALAQKVAVKKTLARVELAERILSALERLENVPFYTRIEELEGVLSDATDALARVRHDPPNDRPTPRELDDLIKRARDCLRAGSDDDGPAPISWSEAFDAAKQEVDE